VLATIEYENRLDADAYVGRTRGSKPEFMLNYGYGGIQIMDLDTHATRAITFPESVESFSVETWLVSPEGSRSYLFGRERGGVGLEIEHDRALTSVIVLPESFEAPTGLCWFAPGLCFRDHYGRNWGLRNHKVEELPSTSLPEHIRLRLRLDDPSAALGVLRMSYDHDGMYVMNTSQIGFASLRDRAPLLVPHNSHDIIDVALAPNDDGLFLCSKERILLWREGKTEELIGPTGRETLLSIESVKSNDKMMLLLISAQIDGSGSTLRQYRLE
jgi:hypothetical protein